MMTDSRTMAESRSGQGPAYERVAHVDPTNIRPLMFLEATRAMMLDAWPYRAVTITMESHEGPGRFSFYAANHVDAVAEVQAGRTDISILNPSAMLNMAQLGVGAFDTPHELATIAVVPHLDQLGFGLSDRLPFNSLEEIAAERYPLRVSTRGSLDVCTTIMIDVVLRAHGFSLADIEAWGGSVSYDQPMPPHPSRIGRLASGEIDAVFDEGVFIWADKLKEAGGRFLALSDERLDALEAQGFRRGTISKERLAGLPADVPTVDYSGWPIYCRADASEDLIERFCRALAAQRDRIVWDIGNVDQDPLPLERMVKESPYTPLDVPLHPSAAAVWREHGWIS